MNEQNTAGSSEMRLVEEIRSSLDASCHSLDAATLSRLNRARQEALASGRKRAFHPQRWLVGAGGAVFASLMAALLLSWGPDGQQAVPATNVAAYEMLLSDGELELYQNLEFYQWLEAMDETTS